MPENLQSCPVCSSLLTKHFLVCKDHTVSQQEFQIVRCESCGFKFTSPRPNETESHDYYQSDAYISHSDTRKGLINQVYGLVRNYTLRQKLNLVNSLVEKIEGKKGEFGEWWFGNRLLDIGCGTGHFLSLCQKAGWDTKGIEPDPHARKQAIDNSKSETKGDFLTAYENEYFSVITMWHVLEHIHRLEETLQKINRNLTDNGRLVIAVPNCDSWDARHYGEHWAAYDVPRHLYHFSPKTLAKLLAKYGFEVESTRPMRFDAYYISLLSSKYQSGKTRYWQALRNGWRSNSWAARNGKNYSSLTYVLRKTAVSVG